MQGMRVSARSARADIAQKDLIQVLGVLAELALLLLAEALRELGQLGELRLDLPLLPLQRRRLPQQLLPAGRCGAVGAAITPPARGGSPHAACPASSIDPPCLTVLLFVISMCFTEASHTYLTCLVSVAQLLQSPFDASSDLRFSLRASASAAWL